MYTHSSVNEINQTDARVSRDPDLAHKGKRENAKKQTKSQSVQRSYSKQTEAELEHVCCHAAEGGARPLKL